MSKENFENLLKEMAYQAIENDYGPVDDMTNEEFEVCAAAVLALVQLSLNVDVL